MKDSGRGIPDRSDSLLKKRSLNVTAPWIQWKTRPLDTIHFMVIPFALI